MESCSQSTDDDTTAEVSHDLTEDLSQQLEDIISTYHVSDQPGEAEDAEEEAVPDKDKTKDQKTEKKMLKGLGESHARYLTPCHSIWNVISDQLNPIIFLLMLSDCVTKALCVNNHREGSHAAHAEPE